MKCRVKKIKICDILTILLFLSCFNNRYIEMHVTNYSQIRVIISIVSMIFVLLDIFLIQHKIRFSKTIIYVLLLFFIISLSTVLNKNSLQMPIRGFYGVFLLLIYLDVNRDRDICRILNILSIMIFLLVVIDVISELTFPMGMYTYTYTNNWFLGYKTDRIQYTLPACMMRVYLDYVQSEKVRKETFLYILFMMIDVALSQTTMGGLVFLIVFVMLFISSSQQYLQKKWIIQLYNLLLGSKLIVSFYIAITVILVFAQEINIFRVILAFFGKSTTLSGRLGIWTRALNLIKTKPLLGYGFQTTVLSRELINFSNAHNVVIAVLMNGGLVLLIVYIFMLVYGVRTTKKIQYGNSMVIFIYAYIFLGISSANFVFSPFAMFQFWLIEYAANQYAVIDPVSTQRLLRGNVY